MDIHYTAEAEVTTTEPFTCGRCAYEGRGQSTANERASERRGGMLFGNDRASEMAADEASATAWAEAMSDVAMAPCPQCGAVERNEWMRWFTKRPYLPKAVRGVAVLMFGVLLCSAIFTAGNVGSLVFALIGGPGMLLAGVALLALPILRKRASTRRVTFTPPRSDVSAMTGDNEACTVRTVGVEG